MTIVNFAGNHIRVKGFNLTALSVHSPSLEDTRVIDFPISNMTNSGIDHIQVYIRRKPRALVEHLGTWTPL